MEDVLKQFTSALLEQEVASHTVRAYLSDVAAFRRWFEETNGEPLSPEAITPTDIREYKAFLQAIVGAKPTTINRRLAALRRFCHWALSTGLIADDPTRHTKGVERTQPAPRGLDRKQVNALLRQVERDHHKHAKRNLAIIQLLRHTGIRVGELCQLTVRDLELTPRAGKVIVRQGKGGHYRELPLNADVRRVLWAYLKQHGFQDQDIKHDVANQALFFGQRRNPLTPSAVYDIVVQYARKAGLDGVSPHTLRHTFAKTLLSAGAGLVEVASLLGHGRLDTTAIYTQPTQHDLEQAVSRVATESD